MKEYRVRRARPIAAEISVSGDRPVSHRALVVAALANGPSVLSGFLPAAECLQTLQALRTLGAGIDFLSGTEEDPAGIPVEGEAEEGPTLLRIRGLSMRPVVPSGMVDAGNSFETLALVSGILAGQSSTSRLTAHASLPRERVKVLVEALRESGAKVETPGGDTLFPLTITGVVPREARSLRTPVRDVAVKGALLLAGLFAGGKTSLTQTATLPDHLERLLRHFQVKTKRERQEVTVYGGQVPESRDLFIPGDFSHAAHWIAAAAVQPDAALVIRNLGLNDTRTGFLRVLVKMGARIQEEIDNRGGGEPWGNVIVRGAPLRGVTITAEESVLMREEIPLLAVAGAMAAGLTVIHLPAAENALADSLATHLKTMGVNARRTEHGLEITGGGGRPLKAARFSSLGERCLAGAFAVAGLFADGETVIGDTECVDSVWPDFARTLRHFQDRAISEGSHVPVFSPVPVPDKKRRRSREADAPSGR